MPSYAITGAGRGLGLGFVRSLSSNADNIVFALVRNLAAADELQALARELQNVHVLQADIADHVALKAAAAAVGEKTGGRLDVLINNAALMIHPRSFQPLDAYPEGQEDVMEADLTDMIKTNTIGVVHTINAFLSLIKAGELKKVATISSPLGLASFTLDTGNDLHGPYSISKAAVNMVIAKYAVRHRSEGIVFLGLNPGIVNTQRPNMEIPSEVRERLAPITATYKQLYPGFKGPITVEESVSALLEVIGQATVESSGKVLSKVGDEKSWL